MALHPYPTYRRGTSQSTHLAPISASLVPVRIVPAWLEHLSSVESACKPQEAPEVVQEPPLVDTKILSRNLPRRRRSESSEGIWFLGSNASTSWIGSLRLALSTTEAKDLRGLNGNLLVQLVTQKTPNLSRYLSMPPARTQPMTFTSGKSTNVEERVPGLPLSPGQRVQASTRPSPISMNREDLEGTTCS